MSEKNSNPYDMDSTSFESEKYLEKLLKVHFSHCKFISVSKRLQKRSAASEMSKIFIDKNHTQNVLQRMREIVEYDVILIAGDTEEFRIPAHRFVLSASTDYFKTMFTLPYSESTAREVKLPGVDGEALKSLVEFIYSGRLEIKEDNVEKLIVAADSLLLDAVVSACSNYLSRLLDSRNCLHFIQLAERHNFVSLLKNAKDYCLMNFVKVYKTDEFLDLNADQLRLLLASDYLFETKVFNYNETDCNNRTEQYVFKSIMTWLKYDPLEREQYKDELLKLVRMPLLELSFLINTVQPVCTSTVSQQLVAKAMECHLLPESTKLIVSLTKPRKRINQHLMAIACCDYSDNPVMLYDSTASGSFTEETEELVENRYRFGFAIMANDMFIVGGFNKHGLNMPLNTVVCLNILTMTSSDIKPMYKHRRDVSVAALKGFLYAVGGHDGESCLNTVEKYDKETNTWSEVAPMSDSRQNCNVAILMEKLYAVGGINSDGYLDLAECYDSQLNVWTKIASVNEEACYKASVTVAGDLLYLVGGRDYKVIQMYDPKEDKWLMMGRLPTKDINVPIWTFKDKVMVLDKHNFWEFDPIESEWNKVGNKIDLENVQCIFSYAGELHHSNFYPKQE